jgi:3-methyladenine DNA glycosylase AlkD
MTYAEVIRRIKSLGNPEAVKGMARYGINPQNAYGVSVPALRAMARKIGTDHGLALRLWASGIHDARILAPMIADPALVTEEQMESWVRDFDSWDICDQCCSNLFDQTPFVYAKAVEWSGREAEFVKRAGFVLMAAAAVHNKQTPDAQFAKFLPIIKRGAADERNFVKKAVNWALRQIGKRSPGLNAKAIAVAQAILASAKTPGARWIASDALRELMSAKVQARLRTRRL